MKDNDNVIEFVARPVEFNNQTVETKATANDFEKKIHNCYFLLFDNTTGARINTPVNLVSSGTTILPTQTIKLDKVNTNSVTACFIANIPSDFANGIIGTTKPESEPASENNKYLNTAVLSNITYGSGANFGIPSIDLDGAGSNPAVPCIPMFGIQENITLSTTSVSTVIQIPVKRLFAKITIDLSVDLDDLGTLNVLSESCFDLRSCTITNLPTAVSLYTPSSENETYWASITTASNQYSSYFTSSTVSYSNKLVYNDDSISSNKSYTCDFYVPEYYLNPLTQDEYNQLSAANPELRPSTSYGSEMYKPLAYSSSKSPIYVTLTGIYDQIPGDMNLSYDIYLGENETNSYTLKRNTWYKNYLKIRGFSSAEMDHRVTISGDLGLVDVYGQVANCYIISEPRDYSFYAYKGAHTAQALKNIDDKYKCTKGTKVKIKYKDSNLILLSDNNFTVTYDDERGVNKISFTVPGTGTTWSGNVVFDLIYTDENGNEQTEWSWHLWFVPGISIGTSAIVELGSHTMPDENHSEMMNRNLGITSVVGSVSTEIGAYYKSGFKEPYFNAKNNKAANEGNTDLYKPYGGGSITGYTPTWNVDGKSVTDPCPPGYKVPSSSIWTDEYSIVNGYSDGAYLYCIDVSDNQVEVKYPFSECLNSQDKQAEKETTTEPLTYTGAYVEYSSTPGSVSRVTIARRYRNITYNVPINLNSGYLHAADAIFKYQAYFQESAEWWKDIFSKYEITDIQWQKGEVIRTSLRPLRYAIQYPDENGDWNTLSDINILELGTYEAAQQTVIEDALESHIKTSSIEYADSKVIPIDIDNRYQVRCVRM